MGAVLDTTVGTDTTVGIEPWARFTNNLKIYLKIILSPVVSSWVHKIFLR